MLCHPIICVKIFHWKRFTPAVPLRLQLKLQTLEVMPMSSCYVGSEACLVFNSSSSPPPPLPNVSRAASLACQWGCPRSLSKRNITTRLCQPTCPVRSKKGFKASALYLVRWGGGGVKRTKMPKKITV